MCVRIAVDCGLRCVRWRVLRLHAVMFVRLFGPRKLHVTVRCFGMLRDLCGAGRSGADTFMRL